MKDYYDILGVPTDASLDEIRSGFRKLAFEHHPDKNPGNERQAEERFKEINEAYSILGNEMKKVEYDAFRNGSFAGVGYDRAFQGFRYSQEDIFRNAFSNRAVFEELNRMFSEAGLRFDEDFLNRVFFSGKQGIHFQFFSSSGGFRRGYYSSGRALDDNEDPYFYSPQHVARKPNFVERMLGRAISKLGKYMLKKAFGIDLDLPLRGEDISKRITISSQEAIHGCRKKVRYQRGKKKKTLEVTIPAGVVSGNKIKFDGMGQEGLNPGDLYLSIKVK